MKKIFLALAILFAIIPAIFVIHEAGGLAAFKGVPPEGITDSLYYYARIHEAADGHPFIGNPYIFEYRNTLSPAFFLTDVVAALPLYAGLPFNIAMMVNVAIWSFVFLFLSFEIFKLFGMPKWRNLLWTVVLFIGSYSFMLRPVVMQIVYPIYLLFLLMLLKYLLEPWSRRRALYLALASALSFYVYTYLAYIVLLTFVLIFIWFLLKRRYKELRNLVTAGIYTALMLVPFGIYTLIQVRGVYYFETLKRIGLVHTHIPSLEAFFYGRWVVLALIMFFVLWRFFPRGEDNPPKKIFWLATGLGLIGGLFLNVLTGAELTLAIHIGRFVILWAALALAIGAEHWFKSRTFGGHRYKYLVLTIVVLVLAGGVVRNVPRGLVYFSFPERDESIADLQSYAAPLKWLEDKVPEQSVIWSNDSLSHYIPIMTRHYTLFASSAALHNIPNTELEDRYMLSRLTSNVSVADLKHDLSLYTAAGPSKEEPLAQNRRAWLCGLAKHIIKSLNCPSATDAVTLQGDAYFDELERRYVELAKSRFTLLKQYHVSYILLDSKNDNMLFANFGKSVYNDGRFEILSLSL